MSSSFAGNAQPSGKTEAQVTQASLPVYAPNLTYGTNLGAASYPGYPYDPQTLAYYNAYYGQITAAAGTLPAATSSFLPAASSQSLPNNSGINTQKSSSNFDEEASDRQNSKNVLSVHGNDKTMNLNPMLLKNIQQSLYFRTTLYSLKTTGEVIDEIWNNVKHMEPWERGSRNTSGQTGMCGSVRGVGAGGIVSTPFCLLYKLFTLRPTRKQVMSFIKSKDSPYIRAIGLLYVRFTQPPDQLWQWFHRYLSDTEELRAKAGGGPPMTIGDMCRHLLTKLDWFSAHFPRIPIPIQKDIEQKLAEYDESQEPSEETSSKKYSDDKDASYKRHRESSKDRYDKRAKKSRSRERDRRSRSRDRRNRSRSRDRTSRRHESDYRRHSRRPDEERSRHRYH